MFKNSTLEAEIVQSSHCVSIIYVKTDFKNLQRIRLIGVVLTKGQQLETAMASCGFRHGKILSRSLWLRVPRPHSQSSSVRGFSSTAVPAHLEASCLSVYHTSSNPNRRLRFLSYCVVWVIVKLRHELGTLVYVLFKREK